MLKSGDVFGRFAIFGLIGTGGMADVYEARDTKLDRLVALKIVRFDDADAEASTIARARLLREARAAAAIVHPNAVAVFDVGDVEGTPYLAMERLRGKTLRHYVGDPSVPMKARLRWLVEIANALGAAHAKGIVHRDVKPENVIVTDDGVAKVLDFGLARTVAQVDRSAETRTGVGGISGGVETLTHSAFTDAGVVRGTPDYMSPEQLRGDALDGRADQWAWAVVCYELVSGQRPWPLAGDSVDQINKILADPPPSLDSKALSERQWAAVARCLSKNPRDRFADIALAATAVSSTASSPLVRRAFYVTLGLFIACALGATARSRVQDRTADLANVSSDAAVSPPTQAEAFFEAGLQALRDGSKKAALNDFDAAIALDRHFAAAHLRWALNTVFIDDETRAHFEAARENRFRLDSHDAPLIDAIEPWMRNVPDLPEAERRLTSLQPRAGFDADYMLVRAKFRALSGNAQGALEDLNELVRRQATSAETYRLRGRVSMELNRALEAKADFEHCVEMSPSASSCLQYLDDFYSDNGDCEKAEDISRRLIAIDPREPRWYSFLARALFGRGAPIAAVNEAVRRANANANSDPKRIKELTDLASLDVLHGDTKTLDEHLSEWEKLAAKSSVDDVHYTFMRFKTWALFEENRPADAADAAAAYLRKRSGLIIEPLDTDSSIFAHQVLYRAQRINRFEMAQARAAWLHGLVAESSGRVWVWGFADGIVDSQDALDAFAVLSAYAPLPDEAIRSMRFDEPIGRALLAAGRPRDALPVLRRATSSCRALEFPFRYLHALVDLGTASERLNQVGAACDAYAMILRVLGKSGLHSAQLADRRSAHLSCSTHSTRKITGHE